MGALRWALAQIRRSIGDPNSFRNDPVEANLGASLQVDVVHLNQLEVDLSDIPGELLEGIDVAWSAEFDVWLSVDVGEQPARLKQPCTPQRCRPS